MAERKKPKVLIVDDSKDDRDMIAAFIAREYGSDQAADGTQALNLLAKGGYSAILLDIEFEGGEDGFAILARLAEKHGDVPVVMVTKFNDYERLKRAIRLNAFEYVYKRNLSASLLIAIEQAIDYAALRGARANSWDKPASISDRFVGKSAAVARIKADIERAAENTEPVLITGETGTGKDLVAELIHETSKRGRYPLLQLIMGERAPGYIADDLWGHVPGSIQGLEGGRAGYVESADRTTLFINEIGDINRGLQAMLLRVIDKGVFTKLGSVVEQEVDVRFILATNRDIDEMARRGTFRADLLYRMNVCRIHIPPLRERPEDIPVLAEYFIADYGRKKGRPNIRASSDVLEALARYEWRGNARELQSAIIRGIQSIKGNQLFLRDIMSGPSLMDTSMPFKEAKARFEAEYFGNLMRKYDGNVIKIAEHAGVTPRCVYDYFKKLGL